MYIIENIISINFVDSEPQRCRILNNKNHLVWVKNKKKKLKIYIFEELRTKYRKHARQSNNKHKQLSKD